jgi:Bacteriophage CI repressor helix-turn-helix domain
MKRNLDVDAFYGALESKKSELGVSWRSLAAELDLPDHTVFTRMSRGQTPDVGTLLSLSAWLGVPLETYAHGGSPCPTAAPGRLSRSAASCARTTR